jgi:hypothetical protein
MPVLQRVRTRELEATLERVQGELTAQGLALEAMASDGEAARMAASETADRIKVQKVHLPDELAAALRCLIQRQHLTRCIVGRCRHEPFPSLQNEY